MLTRQHIQLDQSEVYYWERNAHLQNTVVFIHGFKGEHSGLSNITTPFREYRIILLDLPGYGQSSPMNKPHTLSNYAVFIHHFCQTLKISKFHLVGHSYGGSIAILLAGMYPQALQSVSLLMPAIPDHSISRLLVSAGLGVNRLFPQPLQKVWLYSPPVEAISFISMTRTFSRKRKLKAIANKFKRPLPQNLQVLTECLQSYNHTQFFNFAKRIAVPTLIIGGTSDFIAPLRALTLLHKTIPDSQLRVIPRAGHLANLESPGTLASLIMTFIEKPAEKVAPISLQTTTSHRLKSGTV